jgi:hypothetical protein
MYSIDQQRRQLEFIVPKDLRQGIVNNVKDSYQFRFT